MKMKGRRQSQNISDRRGKQDRLSRDEIIRRKINDGISALSYPRDATPEMKSRAKALGLGDSLSKIDANKRKSEARRRTRMERVK